MRTLEEFRAYYEQTLRPELVKVQARRDATRPRFWRVWRWWLLGAAGVMATMLTLQALGVIRNPFVATMPIPFAWFVALFVVPIVFAVRSNRWARKTGAVEKNLTLVPVIRFLAPEFDYKKNRFVSGKKVEDSRLFELSGKLTSVSGDDHFSGKIGETAVEFSEITAKTSYRVRRKGRWETVRSADTGLFLAADFNKPFQHRTLVLPDFREKLLGAEISGFIGGLTGFISAVESTMGQAGGLREGMREGVPTPQQAGLQPIRLENLEFERLFQVYCTDPVEANYILTPNIMERLAAFQQRMKYPLSLSFVGASMYAFIPSGELFEGDVAADVTRFEAYQPYYEQLYVVFDLVEAMNLNTRLWTKN